MSSSFYSCVVSSLTEEIRFVIDTQLEELPLPEGPVLELLNSVSIAKRMANMSLQGFGKTQETNRKKNERAGLIAPKESTKGRVWKNKPTPTSTSSSAKAPDAGKSAGDRKTKKAKVTAP